MFQNASSMPAAAAKVHNLLFQEAALLHTQWNMFRSLYANNQAAVDLLNRSAQSFFRTLQDILLNNVLLGICRLTDRAQVVGNDTASLAQLIQQIDPIGYPTLRAELDADLQTITAQSRFARVLRDQRIAHADLNAAQNSLPSFTLGQIEDVLTMIRGILNKVERHFDGAETAYEHTITGPGDTEALLGCLKDADAYRKSRRDSLLGTSS